jgi:hypothetical protein
MPVPIDSGTVFARVKNELSRFQKTAAIDHTGTMFEIELKPNGRVKVMNLESRARELGVMDAIECRGGDWAAEPR